MVTNLQEGKGNEKIHIDQLPLKAVHETEKHSGTVILKNQSFVK